MVSCISGWSWIYTMLLKMSLIFLFISVRFGMTGFGTMPGLCSARDWTRGLCMLVKCSAHWYVPSYTPLFYGVTFLHMISLRSIFSCIYLFTLCVPLLESFVLWEHTVFSLLDGVQPYFSGWFWTLRNNDSLTSGPRNAETPRPVPLFQAVGKALSVFFSLLEPHHLK